MLQFLAATVALLLGTCAALPVWGGGKTERIARVERGLLPPVTVQGEPSWTLAERMAHHRVPGVSVAVIENFEVAWEKGHGLADSATGVPVTERTLFQAASISKPVTAAAFMRLVDQKRLVLEAEVNSVLRLWKLPDNKFTEARKITFKHLLSHSGGTTVHGFPGYAADDPVPSLIQVLDGEPPANTEPVRVDKLPGEGFRYSGGGTTIVQQALQDVSGQPFAVLMRETLLEPLGLTGSTYQQPLPLKRLGESSAGHLANGQPIAGKRHTYPEQAAAGLWTTAGDLARFAVAIQRSARGDSGAFLSQASAQRMLTQVAAPGGIGFMVDIPKPGYFSHSGGNEGFRCILIAHKEKGYGAVVMTNSDGGRELASELIRSIAREYGWEGLPEEVLKPLAVSEERLNALAGRWRVGADSVVALRARNGRLAGVTALEPHFELIPIGPDTFVRTDRKVRYRFSGQGEALRLVLEEDGKETPVPRQGARQAPSELLAAGETRAAHRAYRRALKANPKDETLARERLTELGNAALLRGDAVVAVALLAIHIELYPRSALAQYALAEAQIARGDSKAAAISLRKALSLVKSDPEVASFREAARYAAKKRLQSLTVQCDSERGDESEQIPRCPQKTNRVQSR